MITETQPCMIVLQLTDALLAQLQPFLAGLDITTSSHQCLTMRTEVYTALTEQAGSALDYDVRWQPNEYEPEGFIERVRPLELINGILVPSECLHCGTQILANHAEVACVCGQIVSLISLQDRAARAQLQSVVRHERMAGYIGLIAQKAAAVGRAPVQRRVS